MFGEIKNNQLCRKRRCFRKEEEMIQATPEQRTVEGIVRGKMLRG